jgi:hypothetical protein
MKKSWFSEEKINRESRRQGLLRLPSAARHGISSAASDKWKGEVGGREVSDAKRLYAGGREREAKEALAGATLDKP